MRKLISIILLANILFASNSYAQDANALIGNLLNSNKPFELKEEYEKHKAQLHPMLDYMAQAILANSFNQPEKGIKVLDTLLSNPEYQAQLGIANIANLVHLQTKFYIDIFEFEKAEQVLKSFIESADTYLDSTSVANLKTTLEYYQAIVSSPKIEILKPNKDCEVSCRLEYNPLLAKKFNKKTLATSLMVNCFVNGEAAEMIFDSGNPSFNFVSEEFAKRYGIKKIDGSIDVGGIGVGTGKAWIGVADTMVLGDITCVNPIFYVVESLLPAEIVSDTLPQIHAVLGSNILFRLGEYQYFPKKNKLIFPKEETLKPDFAPNMTMKDSRHQYIKVETDNKEILMHFDSGASFSDLSHEYYNRNRSLVEKLEVRDYFNIAGFGGVVKQVAYRIPSFDFRLGNTSFSMQEMTVRTQASYFDNEYGVLGLDFFSDCQKLTVNYSKMFISVEK